MIKDRIAIATAVAAAAAIRYQNDQAARMGERGATAVEYALIVALIAAVIIAITGLLGVSTADNFQAPINQPAPAAP